MKPIPSSAGAPFAFASRAPIFSALNFEPYCGPVPAATLKLMYPMISGVDELDQANELLEECKAELRAEGTAFDEDSKSAS